MEGSKVNLEDILEWSFHKTPSLSFLKQVLFMTQAMLHMDHQYSANFAIHSKLNRQPLRIMWLSMAEQWQSLINRVRILTTLCSSISLTAL